MSNNLVDLPNISLDSLEEEDNGGKKKFKESNFDTKNYLNVRVPEGKDSKTLTIRLLPMDLETGNPFTKIWVHNVKVPQDMVKKGDKPYKSYICVAKTKDVDHDKYGTKCPFCELNKAAYTQSLTETDATKKKSLQELSLDNLAKEAVIVRCIERGNEDEGVKFWKFNIRQSDKQDPYNQIRQLTTMRKESAAKKGKVENILDIYEGRDLTVTISAEKTAPPTIIDDGDKTPLSENKEQMSAWIYDKKKWQDVFTCKPYEYLELVSQMKTPWFDNSKGIWVDKAEYDAEHKANTENIDNQIESAEYRVKMNEATSEKQQKTSVVDSITIKDDEDLPF